MNYPFKIIASFSVFPAAFIHINFSLFICLSESFIVSFHSGLHYTLSHSLIAFLFKQKAGQTGSPPSMRLPPPYRPPSQVQEEEQQEEEREDEEQAKGESLLIVPNWTSCASYVHHWLCSELHTTILVYYFVANSEDTLQIFCMHGIPVKPNTYSL